MADQVKKLRSDGAELSAKGKAEVALVLAKQIVVWADKYTTTSAQTDRRALDVQLAEAYLHAGRFERSRELFGTLVVTDEGSALPTDPTDLRAMLGYAESLFQLGDWSAALPTFNKLAIALPPADPIRWKSLLRDLQCRTALGQPPGDLINVIEQQRFLYPDLGGPALAAEFQKLQRENQRRADAD
ncbi:MAG: tetratricopeptide repeat protein [Planctomycetota bacterium]|jgi:tetratricopeptide (TPR) repeat protein